MLALSYNTFHFLTQIWVPCAGPGSTLL